MAEIILPPEENEETPQVPELNIDKPTDNSKVITIEFEAKKTNKVSTKDTNQQLYTTDTDAWFEFKETSLEGANGTYSVVFRNRHDGSIFQRTGDVVGGVAYYKIPHQEIRHAGAWRGQIVYTLSTGDTTAREFGYDVKGHILDGKDVREIVVEDFETLMSQLKNMKDSAEVELAGLVNTANQNETDRQAFFDDLVEDIDELQANYQELLDTGVLQTNINTKLEALEEEYAPKLTEVTAQLAQTDSRISEIITTPVDGTITQQEIIDARQGHTSLGDNFQTVKNNVTNIDKRTVIPMINHIKNGNFVDETAQWSGLDRSSISVVNNTLINKALGGYNVGWTQQSAIPIPFTIGRKVFIKARVRVTNEAATEISVFFTNANGEHPISTSKIKNPIINKWYNIHEIISISSGVPTDLSRIRFEHKYTDKTIASGKEMEIQNVMTIDLTADFKATPSVADVLGILSKYPNEWFDKVGTQKTVDDIYDTIIKQNDVYLENEIQNGGFTNGTIGWRSSHSTIDIQAENGELVATANVDGTAFDAVYSITEVTQGDEYYVSYEIKPFRTHSTKFFLGGVTVDVDPVIPAGVFSKVSGTVTTIDNTFLNMYANGGVSTGVVEGVQTIFRKPIVINMSKKFGAGNEPTKEYMDNLIGRLGWFDNRKVLSASELMFLIKTTGSLDDALTYENEPWEEM